MRTSVTEEIGTEILRLLALGYTQRAVADKLGFSRSTVQKWLAEQAGRTPLPSPSPRDTTPPLSLQWQTAMRTRGLLA